MDTQQDPNHPRDLDHVEEPLDGANQSLADALRASFSALKGIMLVLVVLYLFSNVRTIGSHEQALVLRLGECLDEVHEAGLVWAFPFPLDEIVPLPTRKSNDVLIDSHTFHRREEEIGKPLSFISRGPNRGLDPVRDGALLTADAGLVHTRWKVTYKFDDVRGFVTRIAGDEVEAAERLIRTLVETIGVQLHHRHVIDSFEQVATLTVVLRKAGTGKKPQRGKQARQQRAIERGLGTRASTWRGFHFFR